MMNKPDLSEARDYLQTYADKALVAIGSMPMQQRFATGYADTAQCTCTPKAWKGPRLK